VFAERGEVAVSQFDMVTEQEHLLERAAKEIAAWAG
jgi:hypothetical protein